MRLIDADALKKCKVYSEERHEYVVSAFNIDNAPTVEPKLKDDIVEAFNLITDQEFEHSDSFWIVTPKGKKVEFEKKRPTGEWIIENDVYCICPFCNFKDVKYSNYCPDCGAKMEVQDEEA